MSRPLPEHVHIHPCKHTSTQIPTNTCSLFPALAVYSLDVCLPHSGMAFHSVYSNYLSSEFLLLSVLFICHRPSSQLDCKLFSEVKSISCSSLFSVVLSQSINISLNYFTSNRSRILMFGAEHLEQMYLFMRN